MVLVEIDSKAHPNGVKGVKTSFKSAAFHRDLGHEFQKLTRSEGNFVTLEDGRRIFDASGGPSVGAIGWGNRRVIQAVMKQMMDTAYCASLYYTTQVHEDLCQDLVDSTDGEMARAYIVNSGSEATEAAVKLARQYFLELNPPQPQRTRFINRRQSYHGTTLGALSVSGHLYRRANFEPLLLKNVSSVSPCFEFRGRRASESPSDYVERLAKELDDEFQEQGPENVCAFIAEPVVGAALGCVPSVRGYFQAMQAVCHKYGALLILDEVMCGMGRTGTLHAWQQEGVVPDIQTIGKALGGGYQPVAGVLASRRVVNVIQRGTSAFVHGHTYQGHPAGCAAALEVQRIIREENLLENVRSQGALLEKLLKELLGDHPNVGNIRGRGLFWGIEFVADKETLRAFPSDEHVSLQITELGLGEKYQIGVYPGAGSVNGLEGDHIILSPAFNVTSDEIQWIASNVARLVTDFFAERIGA
ncbi:Pyridoxal phosphate-dependent transferase [Rhypophila sp. PSN 637]